MPLSALRNPNAPVTTKPRPWLAVVGVVLSAVLMASALPPFSLWPLAWVALVPLWRAVLTTITTSWRRAAGYGLLWGGVYYGLSLAWITHLHPLMWMGVPWLGSVAIALFAWGFITLWGSVCIVLWAVGLRAVGRHWPGSVGLRILAGTALWVVLETLRNYSPLDWSPLGLTQSPNNLWMLHLSRWGGPAILTALVVAVNGLWAEALPDLRRGLRGRSRLGWIGLALVLISHGLGAWLYVQPAGDRPDQQITLGLVQGNVPTREKLTPAGITQAIRDYGDGYRTLADQGVAAVITPEGALPVIWQEGSPQAAVITETVRQTGVPLWLGTFVPKSPTQRRQYTQTLLELDPDGQAQGRYNKVQLVPLGEYIPFEPIVGRIISRLSPLDSSLVPGDTRQIFATSLGQVAVGICYESAYSRLLRRQVRDGGEFMVTASNNDPYPPWMMIQHHAFDVLRAIESDRWMVRVTNTGLSGWVDSHGHTLWLGSPQQFITYANSLYRHRTQTLYVRWGDWLPTALAGGAIAALAITKLIVKNKAWGETP